MLLTKPASFDFDLCIQDDSYVPTRFVIEEEGPSTFTEQGEKKFLIYGVFLAPLCHLEWNLCTKLTLGNREHKKLLAKSCIFFVIVYRFG